MDRVPVHLQREPLPRAALGRATPQRAVRAPAAPRAGGGRHAPGRHRPRRGRRGGRRPLRQRHAGARGRQPVRGVRAPARPRPAGRRRRQPPAGPSPGRARRRPDRDAGPRPTAPRSSPSRPRRPAHDRPRCRVLLADDAAEMRALLRWALVRDDGASRSSARSPTAPTRSRARPTWRPTSSCSTSRCRARRPASCCARWPADRRPDRHLQRLRAGPRRARGGTASWRCTSRRPPTCRSCARRSSRSRAATTPRNT